MPLSLIGSASASADSITLPSHQAGDLLIICVRRGNATPPDLPVSGWTNIAATGSGTSSIRVGYRIATSAAETSGTWTNATRIQALVYRGASTTPIGASATSVTANQVPALTLQRPGTSWVLGFIGSQNALTGPISGLTSRQTQDVAISGDTAGPVSSWAGGSTTGSLGSAAAAVELRAAVPGAALFWAFP